MHFIKTDAKNRHDIDMDQVPTDATLASDFQDTFFWEIPPLSLRRHFGVVSFPKIPSDLNWHDEVESLHRQGRCLRSFMHLGCSSPTCSSRVVGLKPRTSFSVTS